MTEHKDPTTTELAEAFQTTMLCAAEKYADNTKGPFTKAQITAAFIDGAINGAQLIKAFTHGLEELRERRDAAKEPGPTSI